MKIFYGIILTIFIIAAIVVWILLDRVAPYGIILMNRYSAEKLNTLLDKKIDPKEDFSLMVENIEVTVEDTIKLVGWYFPTYKKSKSTVIVLHGINSTREFMLPTAKFFVENGMNVVAFDSRGHGKSGGKYCTYGYYEKKDVLL